MTGLDINVRDGALMTPLMWAAFHGRSEHVRVLIEKGADPGIRDMDGMAAIHWSIQKHDTRVLQVHKLFTAEVNIFYHCPIHLLVSLSLL